MQNEHEGTAQNVSVREASVLAGLLAPFEPEEFVSEWWGRKSLHIKGTPDKFADLFDRERFMAACRYGAERPHIQSFRLSAVVMDYDGSWTRTEQIEPDGIPAALEEGSTVCVNDITIGDDGLSAVCEAVKREMRFAGGVRFNSYLSNNDSGTDTHIDTSISTTLQIEGSKRWRYMREPVVPWPPSNAQVQRDGTRQWSLPWVGQKPWEQLDPIDPDAFEEVVLEAGDFLCLPAGTWHDTRAVGSSLALNMAFAPLDFFTIFNQLLKPVFDESPQWRSGIPPAYAPGEEPPGQIPESIRDYLQARCDEVLAHLESYDAGDHGTAELWRTLID